MSLPLLHGVSIADTEHMIYTEWMRPPRFDASPPTWEQLCAEADDELVVLRKILATDALALHNDTVHSGVRHDPRRLPSMSRFIRSSTAYYFGLARQILVRRQVIDNIHRRSPLMCTEHLEDQLHDLEAALPGWANELDSVKECSHCCVPVSPPSSPMNVCV